MSCVNFHNINKKAELPQRWPRDAPCIRMRLAVWRTRLLNCYYFWCSFYCFYLI